MAKISPIQFFRQVKQEVKKVTWPTRKEVVRTSIMVIVLVAIAATFFFFVDQIFGWVVKLIFGSGSLVRCLHVGMFFMFTPVRRKR